MTLSSPLTLTCSIGLLMLSPFVHSASPPPANTYFAVAVADNSHNHYGENLLYLDFSSTALTRERHPRTVVSRRVEKGGIRLDGKLDEWPLDQLTEIPGRVMNNYPLSRHYDAVPTPIRIGSAFDEENIYFVLHYEDANHDASVDRNRWIYQNGVWQTQTHVLPKPLAPAGKTTNITDTLAGGEDEDQIFMMFPIVDGEKNFQDGGLGCAGYCHTNLVLTPDPARALIGDGVAAMHTNHPDDTADLWHWTATRSRPMATLKDGYIDYGDESYNGRKVDTGSSPFDDNAALDPYRPLYVSRQAYEAGEYQRAGFYTPILIAEDALEITPEMRFAEGVSVPFYRHKPATGSRADVVTAASFDPVTHLWTVEFRRKRVTSDGHDRQFSAGADAPPPTTPLVARGVAARGEKLFKEKSCAACHGDRGEGVFKGGEWHYPRNHRVSGPAIRTTASIFRPKRLENLAAELKKYAGEPPRRLMPFVPLTPQEAEDIAAWLGGQFIAVGR